MKNLTPLYSNAHWTFDLHHISHENNVLGARRKKHHHEKPTRDPKIPDFLIWRSRRVRSAKFRNPQPHPSQHVCWGHTSRLPPSAPPGLRAKIVLHFFRVGSLDFSSNPILPPVLPSSSSSSYSPSSDYTTLPPISHQLSFDWHPFYFYSFLLLLHPTPKLSFDWHPLPLLYY